MAEKLNLHRLVVKIAGESGQGINVVGGMTATILKNSGYYLFASREYPSLIKGGYANYQIDISDYPINSSSEKCDLLVCMSRLSIYKYLETIRRGGTLIHNLLGINFNAEQKQFIINNNIRVEYIDAMKISKDQGGSAITVNMVILGLICKLLDLDLDIAAKLIDKEFADKPQYLELDHKCLKAGHAIEVEHDNLSIKFKANKSLAKSKLIPGNYALSLGVINAGVRVLYAYPMTPASSILSYLAKVQHKTGMVIKQAEDEITAAQMALGSMHMGTRAFTGTSGGGFDLMTETVSLAGMIETPFVVLLAQRPGPATGLPTWTAGSDLNLALHAGHGEFARIILAASDAVSGYNLIQHAYNLAEQFQTVVIVLTEKQIAESLFQLEELPPGVPIDRHLPDQNQLKNLVSTDRYKLTENGVSLRWLPGTASATYNANSDEHSEDGTVNEESLNAKSMAEKRMNKLTAIEQLLPEPEIFGSDSGDIGFIGWGSVKNAVLDAISVLEQNGKTEKINYLHYDYLHPLKTERLLKFIGNHKKIVLVENNYLGQLGELITAKTGYKFEHKLLKYDGRAFYVEEIIGILKD